MGIGLAATPKNPTGMVLLESSKLSVQQLYGDEEILNETIKHIPSLVAVDAPLSLPKNKHAYTREANKEMHPKATQFCLRASDP